MGAAPFLLLALGVLDDRLAAAATLFWLWLLMLVGLAVAVHVTRASIRRPAAL